MGIEASSQMKITDIKLRLVEQGRDGLLAWASCVIDGAIHLNNIAVRRGREGGLMLTYPAKLAASGNRHPYFNPISREAAAQIERAVLGRLRQLTGSAEAGD